MYLNKEAQRAIANAVFNASMHLEPWDRDDLFDKMENQLRTHNTMCVDSMPPERRFKGGNDPHSFRSRIDTLKQIRGLHGNY